MDKRVKFYTKRIFWFNPPAVKVWFHSVFTTTVLNSIQTLSTKSTALEVCFPRAAFGIANFHVSLWGIVKCTMYLPNRRSTKQSPRFSPGPSKAVPAACGQRQVQMGRSCLASVRKGQGHALQVDGGVVSLGSVLMPKLKKMQTSFQGLTNIVWSAKLA